MAGPERLRPEALEEALPPETSVDDPFYLAALEVERDEILAAEMADWACRGPQL